MPLAEGSTLSLSAVRFTGAGAGFTSVDPLNRLTPSEGVTVAREVDPLASCLRGAERVPSIGPLKPFEGVAEVCVAEPLGVCFEGVKVTVEAEKAGRIAIFEGVIDDLGVVSFAIPFAA